jgi:hypothetical protein
VHQAPVLYVGIIESLVGKSRLITLPSTSTEGLRLDKFKVNFSEGIY